MTKRFCDFCNHEIAQYAAPRFESSVDGQTVFIDINSKNIFDGLGWPVDPCLDCLTTILTNGKWSDAESRGEKVA